MWNPFKRLRKVEDELFDKRDVIYRYTDTFRGEPYPAIKYIDKGNLKQRLETLEAIVAELCDYVYRENK